MAWVVYLRSSSLAPFVCIFRALISLLDYILSLSILQGSFHPQTCNTDPEILTQTSATRTKERIFCSWRMGSTRTIGVPLVSPATQHKSHQVPLWLTSVCAGAFVAAPVGGLLWGGGAFGLRVGFQWIQAKRKGHRFDAFDRSPPTQPGVGSFDEEYEGHEEPEERVGPINISPQKGKFF